MCANLVHLENAAIDYSKYDLQKSASIQPRTSLPNFSRNGVSISHPWRGAYTTNKATLSCLSTVGGGGKAKCL